MSDRIGEGAQCGGNLTNGHRCSPALATSELAAPTGSDILCKLVGADMGDDTITLQLPPGMRPRGMVIGEMIIIQRHCPNAEVREPSHE